MIHVVATLRVDPSRREEFLTRFAELTPLVHAEKGCIEYGAAVDEPTGLDAQEMAGDDAVVVIEKWESAQALKDHLAAPHMDEFFQSVNDMLRGLSVRVLRPAT